MNKDTFFKIGFFALLVVVAIALLGSKLSEGDVEDSEIIEEPVEEVIENVEEVVEDTSASDESESEGLKTAGTEEPSSTDTETIE